MESVGVTSGVLVEASLTTRKLRTLWTGARTEGVTLRSQSASLPTLHLTTSLTSQDSI